MKHLFFAILLLFSVAAKSQCDTMTSATFTGITTTSVNVSFTLSGSAWSSFNVTLYDSATGNVAFNNSSLFSTSFVATGLTPNRTYTLRTYTIVPFGGCEPNVLSPKFRTLANIGYTPMNANGYLYKRIAVDSTFHVPFQDTALYNGYLRPGALVIRPQDSSFWGYNGVNWSLLGGSASGLLPLINSKVDSVTYSGDTLYYWKLGVSYGNVTNIAGKLSISDSLVKYVTPTQLKDSLTGYIAKQSQNPTAIISPSISYERRPSGTFSQVFDWTVGREAANATQRATDSILTVSVDGTNRSFTQPSAGASYNGSTTLTITYNTNKRVNLFVTTKDGKSASDFVDVNVYDKRYIGWATTATPSDAEIRAAVEQDNSGGTVAYSVTLAQLGAARYLFYANTIAISSVNINGFTSTGDFTLNTSRTFTNAVGGSRTYLVTVSNALFGNGGQTVAAFQ